LSTAVIKIQSQSSDTTVSDSDAFELFEEFDTESHAPWEWQINNTDEELFEIGIVNAHNSDDIDDDDYQTDPIGLGESIVFPGNYAEISFDSLEDADYASFSVSTGETDFDDGDGNTQTNAMYVEFVSEDGDYFEFSDNTDTDTVYFVWYNLSDDASFEVWYLDSNGAEEYWSTNDYVTIDYNDNQDYVLDASSIDNSTDAVIMTINTVAGSELNLTWNASTDNGWFGLTEDAESADLTYRGSGIGVEDYDVLFADGFYVETPESDLDSNEINFNVPSGDVTATFSIKVVSSTTEFEPVLKTEAAAADYDKLILVGGPCVNTLTADYLGLPVNSCEADSGIAADAALVELVEKDGKTALIVAGYEKADTLRAANAVAAGGLTGTSMIV